MSRTRYAQVFIAMMVMATIAAGAYAADTKLAAGKAAGTFSADGKETKLAYAAAFVDQKDKDKPTILIISDQLLPVSSWKSEMDFMMAKEKFIGVAFWIDKKGQVFRADYHDGTQFPTSTSGIFDLKLDPASGKDLTGSAVSTASAAKQTHPVKLDVKFHATR